LGSVLADFYQQGLTIEEAVHQEHPIAEETPVFEPLALEPELPEEEPLPAEAEPVDLAESFAEEVSPEVEAPEGVVSDASEPEVESRYPSVAEVLSLTGSDEPEE
jgi:hypothetical protein